MSESKDYMEALNQRCQAEGGLGGDNRSVCRTPSWHQRGVFHAQPKALNPLSACHWPNILPARIGISQVNHVR